MGNPRPTRSKPIKIGRKHTDAPGLRKKGRTESGMAKYNSIKIARRRQFKANVSAWWRGEIEHYPAQIPT